MDARRKKIIVGEVPKDGQRVAEKDNCGEVPQDGWSASCRKRIIVARCHKAGERLAIDIHVGNIVRAIGKQK